MLPFNGFLRGAIRCILLRLKQTSFKYQHGEEAEIMSLVLSAESGPRMAMTLGEALPGTHHIHI